MQVRQLKQKDHAPNKQAGNDEWSKSFHYVAHCVLQLFCYGAAPCLFQTDRGDSYRNSTSRVSKRLTPHATACLRARYCKGRAYFKRAAAMVIKNRSASERIVM